MLHLRNKNILYIIHTHTHTNLFRWINFLNVKGKFKYLDENIGELPL